MKDLDRDREVDVRRLVVLLRALLEYTHGELAVTKIHTFFLYASILHRLAHALYDSGFCDFVVGGGKWREREKDKELQSNYREITPNFLSRTVFFFISG